MAEFHGATLDARPAMAPTEADRLRVLRALGIMDTAPEPEYDSVCALAQTIFAVPTVLISLVEEDRQWFKARCGFEQDGTPRTVSFCAKAILADDVLVVEDATQDRRFRDNPLVTGEPGIRFYAGAPLILDAGIRLGTICLIDGTPRAFRSEDRTKLQAFASIVVALLRLHEANGRQGRDIAERAAREALIARQSEALLQRETALRDARRVEEQYRLLAENTSDMIVRIDLSGRRLWATPASKDLLGYEPEELVGSRPVDAIHPDDVARFEAMRAALIAGEREQDTIINRIRHKDGRWIWVEAKWRVLRNATGEAIDFVASLRDFGARQAAEARLLASETLYRTLADSLPQMIWIIRAADRVAVYANQQFHAYYGPIGCDIDDRIARNHPDDIGVIEAAWRQAAREGRTFAAEGRLRRHDEQYRWHRIVSTPLHRDGVIVEWLCTALDIDDIVSARQMLVETSDLLTLAQEAAGAGVFDVDLLSLESTLSRESALMQGFDGSVPIKLSFDQWKAKVDPEDAARSVFAMQKACADRQTYSSEFRVHLEDGRTRWIHGMGRAHYDAAGRAVRVIGLNFDVTDRKASEARLIEATTVAEKARGDAEKASAAKSEFLASMSHEIRTPLNSIIGYTDLLLDDETRPRADRHRLQLIQASGAALLTVVNDILDFSKIEAGQIELDPIAFSLPALVDGVLAMVAGSAELAHLAIDRAVDAAIPEWLVGDSNRLRQVLLNLLNNAIKFTPKGRVGLHVDLDGPVGEGCSLLVRVTDTGIGIARDRHGRLFERFSQVDSSIARRFGGTGLGLAISKSLVQLMGGTIGVESEEGRGSSFWFRIVLPIAAPGGALPATPDQGADAPPRCTRILLVEDVPVNQDLARTILEARGHHVVVASDGLEAIRAVQSGDFDLVLMDVQMPGIDGVTATRRIRALDHACRTIPIIAMTANVLPQQIEEFKAAGMDDHVGKPFKREALYAAVARWSDRHAEAPVDGQRRLPVLDRDTLGDLLDAVGRPHLDRLVARLADELTLRFVAIADPADRGTLARDAHAMIAAAGALGFVSLSQACRDVEAACHQGKDLPAVIRDLQAATHAALQAIAEL